MHNRVESHLERSQLAAVQTPQYFELESLKRAYKEVDIYDQNMILTDESMLMEIINVAVNTVPGDPSNIKITYPTDLSSIQNKASK